MRFWKNTQTPKLQTNEINNFEKILKIWENALMIRWLITTWCNYDCSYCKQDHTRNKHSHAFDSHSPEEWVQAFTNHFENTKIALTITGGETMLDVKNMKNFLVQILQKPFLNNLRLDTNLSWKLDQYKDLPNKEKIILNCSYHPTQTNETMFLAKVAQLTAQGYDIGMVNYVMEKNQTQDYIRLQNTFDKLDIVLNPNPNFHAEPTQETLSILDKTMPEIDIRCKTGYITKDQTCLYPYLAYEMNQQGTIHVGCFPEIKGNIFNTKIPNSPLAPVKCPNQHCGCLDKYSFIKGENRNTTLNTLHNYRVRIQQKRKI